MKYDYYEAVTEAVRELAKELYPLITDIDADDVADLSDKLYEELWADNLVTGNGGEPIPETDEEAEQFLSMNLSLLARALADFDCYDKAVYYLRNPREADVTIRCAILGECCYTVAEELWAAFGKQ